MLRYSPSLSVVAAFDQVVAKFANKTALILPGKDGENDTRLSYAELDKRANAVAAALLERGVKPGTFVATLLEKSLVKRRAGYDEYVARTSPFIPRPPKRTAG